MKCRNCNYESEKDFKYCPECGVNPTKTLKTRDELFSRLDNLETKMDEVSKKLQNKKQDDEDEWDI